MLNNLFPIIITLVKNFPCFKPTFQVCKSYRKDLSKKTSNFLNNFLPWKIFKLKIHCCGKNCKIAKLSLAIGSGLLILYASWMRNDCLWVKFIENCDTHTSSSATMCDLLVILWWLLWLGGNTSALNVPLLLLNCMKTKKIAFYALSRMLPPHRIWQYVCAIFKIQ